MKETGLRSSLFGVLWLFAAPAFAQPPGSPPGKAEAKAEKAAAKAAKAEDKAAAKAAKADDRAQKAEAKEEKADAKGDKAEGRGPRDHHLHGGPGAGPSGHPPGTRPPHAHRGFRGLGFEFSHGKLTKPELEKRIAEMRENRAERRKEHREGLRYRWGAALVHPAVREELRHHARREAFLSRALFLAQTQASPKDKDKLIERIEKLIEKEDARHARAMERLKSMPPPPASAGSAAAAPGASAVPAASPSAASSAKAGAQ